jgi:hypothetical protein
MPRPHLRDAMPAELLDEPHVLTGTAADDVQVNYHGASPTASRRTRRIVAAVLIPCALATLVGLVVMWPGAITRIPDTSGGQRALGTVSTVSATTATVRVTAVRVTAPRRRWTCPRVRARPSCAPGPRWSCSTSRTRCRVAGRTR